MEAGRVFGRTTFGAQEILQKSGRLTQSERLVLIVLGDQVRFDSLLGKLPSLTAERIDGALMRLIELELAYEITQPTGTATIPAPIPASALRSFLAQSEGDPVTVMAAGHGPEPRSQALREAVGRVLESAAPSGVAGEVAIPLGKLFPDSNREEAERLRREAAALRAQRDRAEAQIKALEAQLARSGERKREVSDRRPDGKPERRRRERPEPAQAAEASTGGWALLIAGAVAVVSVATGVLVYALR